MGTSRISALIFILLILSATSNAIIVLNSRKLVDSAPIRSNNSSSKQILPLNTPNKGEKKDNSSTVNGENSEIEKEKPENRDGSNDPLKPGPKEPNSTIDNVGSSQTGKQKPSQTGKQKPDDHQTRNNASKDPIDQATTRGSDGNAKAESKQPKNPQENNDLPKLNSKESNSSRVGGGSSKGEKEKPTDPPPQGSNEPQKLDPNVRKNDKVTAESPPPVEKKENEEKKKVDGTVNTNEGCHRATNICRVEQTLLACIQTPHNGSAELFLVIQNEGEKRVEVNLDIQPPLDSSRQPIKIPKHQTEKVDISSISGKGAEIVVNSGDGSCRLQLDRRVSMDNILQQVSLYSKQVTPVHGAYLFFIVALLFGGIWGCCKLRKKRHQDNGVPYQELEMGMPASANDDVVVTTDGWDEDWDEDWDEENAVKSPGGGLTYGNISANGLTSRSSKRDGWEDDWDD